MSKNLIPEVAALLGVEIGEKFSIQGLDGGPERFEAMLTETGLVLPNFKALNDGGDNTYLAELLKGNLEYEKLPWEPKYKEEYFFPNIRQKTVAIEQWTDETFDYAMKVLGMVYRTHEEAKAHFAEDYERLTGKKLEEQAIVKMTWEPKRGESYYAMSIVGCAQPKIACYDWNGSAADYECLKEGLVHKTQAEAEAHMAEDYERLTGKPLSSLE